MAFLMEWFTGPPTTYMCMDISQADGVIGESFQAQSTYLLGKVGIPFRRVGSPPGNLTIYLYNADSYTGIPTGSPLVQTTPIARTSLPSNAGGDYLEFQFEEPAELVQGQVYAIVAATDQLGDYANRLDWPAVRRLNIPYGNENGVWKRSGAWERYHVEYLPGSYYYFRGCYKNFTTDFNGEYVHPQYGETVQQAYVMVDYYVPSSGWYYVKVFFDGQPHWSNNQALLLFKGNLNRREATADLSDGWHSVYVTLEKTNGYVVGTLDSRGFIVESGTLSKPYSPTPADGSGPGIDFSSRTLSCSAGGAALYFNVYINGNRVATNLTSPSYTIPLSDIAKYRGGVINWRVDVSDGVNWVTGDTWTFDPRPGKATNPTPLSNATNVSRGLSEVTWTTGACADYSKVVLGWYGGVSNILTEENSYNFLNWTPLYFDRLKYNTTYYWRIDSVNAWGTTIGDTWTFKTKSLDYPRAVGYYPGVGYYSLIWDSGTSSWGSPPPVGELDVDYEIVPFVNMIATHNRLVACAGDRLWYEEV